MKKSIGLLLVTIFICFFGFTLLYESQKNTKQTTLLFLVGDNNAEAIIKGVDIFYKKYPEFSKKIDIIIRTPTNTNNGKDQLPPSDFLLARKIEVEFIEKYFDYAQKSSRKVSFLLGSAPAGKYKDEDYKKLGFHVDKQINNYFNYGSPNEISKMIAYLLSHYNGFKELKIEPPVPIIESGFLVYKKGEFGRIVKTWEEWEKEQNPDPNKDKVALLVSGAFVRGEVLNIEKSVAKKLEEKGVEPVFVFGHFAKSAKMTKQTFFDTISLKNKGIKVAISWMYKLAEKKAKKILPKLDIPLINAINVNDLENWRRNKKGLTTHEYAIQLSIPEVNGLVQPTVVGGNTLIDNIPYKTPKEDRVERIVDRTLRYLKLKKLNNNQKKVAIVYYNYPLSKASIGASYLNVIESIPFLMKEMQRSGYHLGDFQYSNKSELQKKIKNKGRNVGKYAPKELEKIIKGGAATLIPISIYKEWFEKLDKGFQKKVIEHWGTPEESQLMTIKQNGKLFFVIPTLSYGNITLMPQPDRARLQDLSSLYHSQTLPPHHQYICQYLWIQKNNDAVIHFGRHGSLEWLDGKEVGLSNSDAPEILIGDMPNFYIYSMDGIGEGFMAKRRGAAIIVDHLVPAMDKSGLSPELKKLDKLVHEYSVIKSSNPEGISNHLEEIEKIVLKLDIKKNLEKDGWNYKVALSKMNKGDAESLIEILDHYIHDVSESAMPKGLHTFGISPTGNNLTNFVNLIADANQKSSSDDKDKYKKNIALSGTQEIASLLHGLNGNYIIPQVGNDPVRNPDAMPTGKNFYSLDPRNIPMAYADSIGRKLAENYIKDFKNKNGDYPKKIAFGLWSTETVRHQGIQEAQILAMLGVKVKRNKKTEQIEGVELIPRDKLGRPRVDVVISTTEPYREVFDASVYLLDDAIKLAAASPEEDNPVRKNSKKIEDELIRAGVSDEDAKIKSQIRIFSVPSGTYGAKMSHAINASGSWEKTEQLVNLYTSRLGHGYGRDIWGDNMEKEYKMMLSGVEEIIHSRSSNLYKSLDSDHFFEYIGSMAMAIRQLDKKEKSPSIMVANLERAGKEKIESLEKYMGRELHSRYFNPEYIKEMQKEGYSGAKTLMQGIEYLWGWEVTNPDLITDEKWQEFYSIYIEDKFNLKTKSFFDKESPFAMQTITGIMVEAMRKGYWKPDKETSDNIIKEYIENITTHGVSCNHNTCDNPQLIEYIKKITLNNPNIGIKVNKMIKIIEDATEKKHQDALNQRLVDIKNWENFNTKYGSNTENLNSQKKDIKNNHQKAKVQGYKMIEEKVINHDKENNSGKQKGTEWFVFSIIGIMWTCIAGGGLQKLLRNK